MTFAIKRAGVGWQDIARQFQGLQGRHPGTWPLIPRLLCAVAVASLVIIAGGWFVWFGQWEELAEGQAEEARQKQAFVEKIRQTGHLDSLRKQKTQVLAEVTKLEQQLPGKSEMDALLSEINQAGVNRGLQFELFKPGQIRVHDYYAELPIEIKLTGHYHALAGFASDIANLKRIVTLDRLGISQSRDGLLGFEGVVHTFRYLDKEELALQKKLAQDGKRGTIK